VAAQIADRFDIRVAQTEPSRWCSLVRTVLSNIKDRETLQRAAERLKLQVDARTNLLPPDATLEQLTYAIVALLHHYKPLEVIRAVPYPKSSFRWTSRNASG